MNKSHFWAFCTVVVSVVFYCLISVRSDHERSSNDKPKEPFEQNLKIRKGFRQTEITSIHADDLRNQAREFQRRLKNINHQIRESPDPEVIFVELGEVISQVKNPIDQRLVAEDIFNQLADFGSSQEALEWLARHDEILKRIFSEIKLTSGLADAYSGVYSVIAGRLKMKGSSTDVAEIISSNEISLPESAKIKLMSSLVSITGDYGLLDKFDQRIRHDILAANLSQSNQLDCGLGIRNYLGPNYHEIQDPQGSLRASIVSPKWAQRNSDEILRIIENSDPGPKRDNLIKLSAKILLLTEEG